MWVLLCHSHRAFCPIVKWANVKGTKSSLSEWIDCGFHHIFWKSWVFLHVCTVKIALLLCPALWITCQNTEDLFGEATGSTKQHPILKVDMWFLTDRSYCKWHFSVVLFMAMNGGGEGMDLTCVTAIKISWLSNVHLNSYKWYILNMNKDRNTLSIDIPKQILFKNLILLLAAFEQRGFLFFSLTTLPHLFIAMFLDFTVWSGVVTAKSTTRR